MFLNGVNDTGNKEKYFEFSFELSSVYFTLGGILAYFSFSGLGKLVLEALLFCWCH